MREEFASYSFLAVTVASLVLLCSGLLTIASIGSASGGNDIVTAQACGANALTHVADASILKRVLSDSVVTRLFATAVTAWNNANVTISIVFGFY